MDFDLINRFIKVTDKDSALRARELARLEGLMCGYSSGAALQALEEIADQLTEDDIVVLLFSDHGSKYVTKFFSDKWMQEQGFMENPTVISK
jgi:cystathionine beta-synthase